MVTVIGLGFVGLTTALGFADAGYKVCGIEKDAVKLQSIRTGRIPFYEPRLAEALEEHLGERFAVHDSYGCVADSRYVFVCVGTPCSENGAADLSYIFSALDDCLAVLNKNRSDCNPVFVIKSTVPPSTTFGAVKNHIAERGFVVGEDCCLANNPEFLREGHAWEDFTKPDRIVIGTDHAVAGERLRELYRPFNAPVHIVSGNTAEFIKYASNATLAALISFSNELAELAETIGDIQVADAFHILHEDERWHNGVMRTYLYPGCGYGGYCLPKDTAALSAAAASKGMDTAILNAVINRNGSMPYSIAKRIAEHADKDGTIGILGLSFKPGSDDVRESSSAKVIAELSKMGFRKFAAYDPVANDMFARTYDLDAAIAYAGSMDEVLERGNPVVILTAWEEFKSLKDQKTDTLILDYRYML